MNTATKRSALAIAVAGICLGASLSQASTAREIAAAEKKGRPMAALAITHRTE